MDDMLLEVLIKEVLSDIPNIKKYRFIHRVITFFVKLQYIGGFVNSFFYKVKKDKCTGCGKCIANCPTKNIYTDTNGNIRFHHNCLMCMRCSMFCPTDAIRIGLFDSWRVNGVYDFKRIRELDIASPVITEDTDGFFKCYKETYADIRARHAALFGEQ